MARTPITDAQIVALRGEAAAAGDREQVRLCDLAMGLYMATEHSERAHSIADDLAERSHPGGGQFSVSPAMRRANERCRKADEALAIAQNARRECEAAIRAAASMAS